MRFVTRLKPIRTWRKWNFFFTDRRIGYDTSYNDGVVIMRMGMNRGGEARWHFDDGRVFAFRQIAENR